MMLDAELSLRGAIRAAILGDPTLAGLLNRGVYDEAPRHAVLPYVSFGDVMLRDWSTGGDRGLEHDFVLDVWSAAPGSRESLQVADLIVALLARASLQLQAHALIDLRFVSFELARQASGRLARGRLRFRAITEIKQGA